MLTSFSARVDDSYTEGGSGAAAASTTDESAAPIPPASGTAGVTQQPAEDVSKATYTERSYKVGEGVQPLQEDVVPLPRESYPTDLADKAKESAAAGSTEDTFSGTTAGIAAGAVGVGAVGAGAAAAAASSGGDDVPEYLKNRDGTKPKETPGSGHVPGEFPGDESEPTKAAEEPSSGAGSAVFLGTAAGAGGAATGLAAIGGDNSTKDTDSTGVPTQGADRDRYFGRPEASPPASPTTAHTTETTSTDRAPVGKGTEEESHTGRDAMLAGGAAAGAGALGYGAYEASKDKDVPTQSTATDSVPSKPPAGSDPAGDILKERQQDTTPASQLGTTYASPSQPSTTETAPIEKQPEEESHIGRDAAIAGGATAGAGALGYGAYEASKDRDTAAPSQPSTTEAAPTQPSATQTAPTQSTMAETAPTQPSTTETAPTQSTTAAPAATEKQPEEESHTGRDAAIAGGAVAATGAAGYGAYELSKDEEAGKQEAERQAAEQKEAARRQQEQQKEAEKRQQEQQKEAEKRQKEQQKEQEKREKEAKKEQEKREKEAKKEEEKKQKEAEKAEKERQKEAEKKEKEERKAAEKREKEEKKEAEKREKERQAEAAAAAKREEDEKKAAEEQAKKEEESHLGRDTAIAGGATAAAGAAGYGAYELSKDDETKPVTSTTQAAEDPATKEGTSKWKDYSLTSISLTSDLVPHQPYSPYSSKGQQAAADASAARDAREEPVAAGTTQDTSRYVDHRQDPAPTTQTAEKPGVEEPASRQTTEPRIESEHSYGEDAAIAGGVGAGAVGAGGAGYAAASSLEGSSLPKGDSNVSAYEHSGKGTVTSQAELDQRFKTYGLHDENPERTQAKMAEIKRLEEEKAKFKGTQEETPKKKEGFLHKILHRHKDKKENEEPKSPGQKEVTTQSGAPIDTGGDAHHLTVDEAHKMGLPIDEHGHIVLKNAAAPADAPHLTITEKPGGGLGTTQK